MEVKNEIANLIKEKKYTEASEIFERTPILDYQTKNPAFKLDYFEFYFKENKNPVFLRVLLNNISLINILIDQVITPSEFHDTLFKFCAKFSYEAEDENNLKLILMAKATIDVYNLIFLEGSKKAFENMSEEIKKTIDFNFENEDDKRLGYTFQELGRVFINDYIVGRDKGIILPNILYYIRSINEIQKIIGKLFIIPEELDLNLTEKLVHSGVNEFDNIILLKEDIKINTNNPYFRYIKSLEGSNAVYKELELKKDEIYILEFKHSFTMNEDVANMQNLGDSYLKLYNKSIYNNIDFRIKSFKILYFYNYLEKLRYKNFSTYLIDKAKWEFLYLSPSCQIVPVTKLTSKVAKLSSKVDELTFKNVELSSKIGELTSKNIELSSKIGELTSTIGQLSSKVETVEKEKEKQQSLIADLIDRMNKIEANQEKGNSNINQDKNKDKEINIIKPLDKLNIGYKIEEEFKALSKDISNKTEINKFNKLFINYKEEISNFKECEKYELNDKDLKWQKELKDDIKDDKTCFEYMAPCIGYKKASVNYEKIQKYFFVKMDKNDEMSEIYKFVYQCFYGRRKLNDKSSREKFYSGEVEIKDLLINVIKYTFYYDKNRNKRAYYFLTIFQELLSSTNEYIQNSIFKLKDRTLYQLVLLTIDLINSKNSDYKLGYFSFPTVNHI